MAKLSRQPMQKRISKAIREQSEPNRVITAFHSLVAVLLTFVICFMAGPAYAADPPAPDKVLSAIGIGAPDVKRLLSGEILTYSTTEPTDKALSNGVVMYVKAAPSRLVDAIKRGALLARDPNVLAYGEIPSGATVRGIQTFHLHR